MSVAHTLGSHLEFFIDKRPTEGSIGDQLRIKTLREASNLLKSIDGPHEDLVKRMDNFAALADPLNAPLSQAITLICNNEPYYFRVYGLGFVLYDPRAKEFRYLKSHITRTAKLDEL